VLTAGVRWKVLDENPAKLVPNPQPKREEIRPFETWDEIGAVADELGPHGTLVLFACGTGLRPEEWLALERRDLDRAERVVYVRRTFSGGELRDFGKTERSRRRVPLRQRVLDALDASRRAWTHRSSFPRSAAGTSACTTSALASGSPRSARPESTRPAASTTVDIATRRYRLRRASPSSRSHGALARACR
jgi:integrase